MIRSTSAGHASPAGAAAVLPSASISVITSLPDEKATAPKWDGTVCNYDTDERGGKPARHESKWGEEEGWCGRGYRTFPGTALAKNPRDCSGRKAPCATPRGVAQHAFSVRSGARGFFPRAQMCAKKLPRASSTGQLLILELCEALQPRLALDRPRCPRAAVRTVLAVAVLEDAFEVSARAGGGAAAARGEAADRHVAEIVRTHHAHPVPLTAAAV